MQFEKLDILKKKNLRAFIFGPVLRALIFVLNCADIVDINALKISWGFGRNNSYIYMQ